MPDTKKDLILKVAREIFAKNGFSKTTLDDIANAIGMNKSSLYYYYSCKDDLINDVIKQEEKKFMEIMEKAMKTTGSTLQRLINYEKEKNNYLEETIKIFDISTSIILEIKQKLFEYIKVIQKKENEMIKTLLEDGIKQHEIRKCDTKKVAELIQTISEGTRHRELYYSLFSFDRKIELGKAFEDTTFALKLIFEGLAPVK